MAPLHENSENEMEDEEILEVIEVDDEGPVENEESDDSTFQILAHTDDVLRIEISNNLHWLGTGSMDDTCTVYDIESNSNEPYMCIKHTDSVEYVSFNFSSALLATGDLKGQIFVTRLENKSMVCDIQDCLKEQNDDDADAPEALKFLFWHKTKDILIGGTGEGIVWAWIIENDEVADIKIFSCATNDPVVSAKLIPNSNQLLAVYQDGFIRSWDLESTAKKELNLGSPCTQLDVHPTKSNIAAVGLEDETTVLVQLDKNAIFARFGEPVKNQQENEANNENSGEVTAVAFCGSHPWLAVGKENGNLTIYDTNTKTTRVTIEHEASAIVSLLWESTKEAIYIISASYDGKIRVMDARDGKILKLLSAGTEIFELIKFAKPNEPLKLIAACAEGVVKMFDL